MRSGAFSVSGGRLRSWHSYVSAFIAPTILFFAFSGTLQIFGFQDPHDGYRPSALLSSLARLHKNQVFAPEPPHDEGAPRARAGARAPREERRPPPPSLATDLLKALFALEAAGLILTTLAGLWIGLTHPRRARTFGLVALAGVVVPVALIVA